MKKRIGELEVIENRRLNGEYFVLVLSPGKEDPGFLPGNFAEFRIDGTPDVMLRRPISIYDVDPHTGNLHFLIRTVGKGTRWLGEVRPGGVLNLIYPLGNSFSMPPDRKVLLAGGGVGVAPLLYLGRVLKREGYRPEFLLGYRTSSLIADRQRFEEFGRVYITTDDGTEGPKGPVTGHPLWKSGDFNYSMIYTCGPLAMMKAVAALARERGVPCEASLENTMGCGFGACLCCVQKTRKGNRLVCTDGPVFNTEDLVW
ncbi:MAG: dihydroorotate dehydrogenase electron transfer subunit [Bacteroidales bacterium]